MLKLERDNLMDKLEVIKRNANEILQSTSELEEDNDNLKNMAKQVEEEMSLSTPVKPVILPPKSVIQPKKEINDQNMNKNKSQVINNNNMINPNKLNQNPNPNMIKSAQTPEQKQKPQGQKAMIKRFKSGLISNILKSDSELANVTQRIQSILNKNIRYNIIYYSRVDGDKAANFHKKCDKARKSLVLVRDSNGNRFGGFTMRDWAGNCIQKKDEKAFIFSVDKNKIYRVLPDQVAIGCYPNFGPIFFGCQIRVYDNFFSKGGSTYLKGQNYATEEDYELTNGCQAFRIKDLEVYEVKEVQ
jgi:hypothetical protein